MLRKQIVSLWPEAVMAMAAIAIVAFLLVSKSYGQATPVPGALPAVKSTAVGATCAPTGQCFGAGLSSSARASVRSGPHAVVARSRVRVGDMMAARPFRSLFGAFLPMRRCR